MARKKKRKNSTTRSIKRGACTRRKATNQTRTASKNTSSKHASKPELVIKTKFSPNLTWMYYYLNRAKRKMPNLILPTRVRSYKPIKAKIMRVMGNAYFSSRAVVIATHTQQTYLSRQGDLKVKKIVRLPKTQMLDTLAHEVAHFQYREHGYEHEEFTRAIFKTFDLKEKCPHCRGSGRVQLEGKP